MSAASTPNTVPATPPPTPPFKPSTPPGTVVPSSSVGLTRPAPTKTRSENRLREVVAALLAAAIAVIALGMLVGTYAAAREVVTVTEKDFDNKPLYAENERLRLESRASQKDIMLVAIGLFGSVLGYYFGRVPAERRAEVAETAASTSQATASDAVLGTAKAQAQARDESIRRSAAERKVWDAKRTLAHILANEGPPQPPRNTLSETAPEPSFGDTSQRLRDLMDRLG